MADIKKIKLPSGSEYNLVDASALHSSDVVSTYSSTGTAPVNGTAVAAALTTLPEPMVFKGTLGTGGTITTLPVNGSAKVGDTYKVITDGTYASQAAKVGDVFICQTKTSTANTWAYVPAGDETDTDTWRNIKVNGTEKLGNGISTGGVDFINGSNTTVSFNSTGNKIKIDASVPVTSVAGKTGAVTLDSSDVGLGNVGNFKAVSTVASQGLTDTEKSNARANIGAGTGNGTITGITMNGASKGTSGVVDLGTVITSHQDISGKADKSATVSTVAYDTTNKKFTKTINGTTSDVAKLSTTTVPNVTSVGSAPTLGTNIPADDITAWTTNTPTAVSLPTYTVSDEVLTIAAGSVTAGTAASLTYTAKSIPNVTSVGSAPTLGTAISVATGFTTT